MIQKKHGSTPPPTKKRYYNSIGYEYCESGRSLVEMLGALAIMGILSMAGIWAYNAAMDKLKANTIINEAQKRAVVVAGQIGLMGSTHPTLGEFKENTFGGGTFSTSVTTEGLYKQFGIQVSGVSKSVCRNILNNIDEGTPIRRLTHAGDPKSSIGSCTDNNNLLLVYNNDMSTSGGDTTYAEDTCGCQTVCGVCVTEGGVSTCKGECPATGTCSATQPCSGDCVGCVIPEGETTGTCQACQRIAYLESTGTQYIDTGVLSKNTETEINFAFASLKNEQAIMGMWKHNPVLIYQVALYQNRWYYGSNMSAEKNVAWIEKNPNTNRHTIKLDGQGGLYQDGTLISSGNVPDVESSLPIFIFGRNMDSAGGLQTKTASLIRCYGVQMKTNDVLVRDFVPVLDPWGVPAMYDKVYHQLYYNQGSEQFIIDGN